MAIAIILGRRCRHAVTIMMVLAATYSVLWFYRLPADFTIPWRPSKPSKDVYDWANRPQQYPIPESTMAQLPYGAPLPLPRIQHDFSKEPKDPRRLEVLRERRQAIDKTFRRSWATYWQYARGHDEVTPQTLQYNDKFGGWGATLVDSLDTLYILEMEAEFREAVRFVSRIDWDESTSPSFSLFETNIRFLGGLLGAYDLSGQQVLLDKALELGHVLYAAFDNPAHMPVNHFEPEQARLGELEPSESEALAVVGSLSMEFTRLTQLTGDPKFYDIIDRIKWEFERTQTSTKLPGMWPMHVDLTRGFAMHDHSFSLGAMSDSMYEYLPKMHALLGGLDEAYGRMHLLAADTIRDHLLFRPMIPDPEVDILFSGTVGTNGKIERFLPDVEHLACFAGGYFALSGRLFDMEQHLDLGEKLTRGCAWAYSAFPSGIMPEMAQVMKCHTSNLERCKWDEERWNNDSMPNAPRAFRSLVSAEYLLRPEAVESLFYMYRTTGKEEYQDMAWTMFQAIANATETEFANSAIANVNAHGQTQKLDSMESFWLAETLKYFYLIFSEPDKVSLDDYVFNTEAHPFSLPKPLGARGIED